MLIQMIFASFEENQAVCHDKGKCFADCYEKATKPSVLSWIKDSFTFLFSIKIFDYKERLIAEILCVYDSSVKYYKKEIEYLVYMQLHELVASSSIEALHLLVLDIVVLSCKLRKRCHEINQYWTFTCGINSVFKEHIKRKEPEMLKRIEGVEDKLILYSSKDPKVLNTMAKLSVSQWHQMQNIESIYQQLFLFFL